MKCLSVVMQLNLFSVTCNILSCGVLDKSVFCVTCNISTYPKICNMSGFNVPICPVIQIKLVTVSHKQASMYPTLTINNYCY
jgi:hypothetical protein